MVPLKEKRIQQILYVPPPLGVSSKRMKSKYLIPFYCLLLTSTAHFKNMANLYLTEQGAILRKTGDRLIVEKDKQVLLEVQCHKIETVLIFGNVQFTTQAVTELFDHGIELALLTKHGRLKGQLTPMKSKNIVLRLAQYEKYKDPQFVLEMSQRIVIAKIANGLALLRRFSYNHPEISLAAETGFLEETLGKVSQQTSVASIRGLEGMAAKVYFEGLKKMCLSSLVFPGRQKRPAPDPINGMLSLGYTLVFNELTSLLDAIGFDPYIGFFHGIDYGRPSLAADLTEEFRHPLVDRFTLNLINKKVFKEEDFFFHEIEKATYFKKEALKEYFRHYENFIQSPFRLEGGQKEATFRDTFRGQAQLLSKCLTEGQPYQPFQWGKDSEE